MKKITDLHDEKILRAIEDQTDLTRENSNLEEALNEAKERGKMYQQFEDAKAQKLLKEGKEPYPCCNMVCKSYVQSENTQIDNSSGVTHFWGRSDYCNTNDSHGCTFQMSSHPPNSLNYEEYMPTHIEALDMLEKHGLLKGDRQRYKEANARYSKVQTQEERHQTEIKGITFAQLHEAVLQLEKEMPDFFNPESAPVAIAQNLCVEVEKAMGIYPNIRLI